MEETPEEIKMRVEIEIDAESVENIVARELRDLYEHVKRCKGDWSKEDWKKDLKSLKRVHNMYVAPENKIF